MTLQEILRSNARYLGIGLRLEIAQYIDQLEAQVGGPQPVVPGSPSRLTTMRANLDFSRLPYGLAGVLRDYDEQRKAVGYDAADIWFRQTDWRLGNQYRLRLGLARLTVRGVTRMARSHADLCGNYVSSHFGDLATLQGLFYWNGSDELVTRILLTAWRKGGE